MKNPNLDSVLAHLETFAIEQDDVDGKAFIQNTVDVNKYRRDHGRRLWHSLQIVNNLVTPGQPLRILELGASPYFFTALLLHYIECEVTGVNVRAGVWPGAANAEAERSSVRLRQGKDASATTHDVEIYIFNIEKDPFPFPDDAFDLVLCMETIEHLVYSPSHMLAESGRVLRPGGALLVSTPNAIDMNKTIRMIQNLPLGFYYSGYGVYGRHNREFAPDELEKLVTACGFRVTKMWLKNPYLRFEYWPLRRLIASLVYTSTNLPLSYLRNKREYMYLLAESTRQHQAAYPETLYLWRHLYPDYAQARVDEDDQG
mgnify:CR=1 FL=1